MAFYQPYMMWPFYLSPGIFALLILILIWSAVWKAIALWKSARNDDLAWFIVFLIINTAGILEIIYIFLISKNRKCCECEEERKPEKKVRAKKR
ncbi:MAG: DUF5652 family protein [Candidatus Woesearchaeota archaeon]